MILAGCLVRESVERELKSLGVKDSKQLTQKRREFLEKAIKEKAESFEVVILYPEEIDTKNLEGTKLNELEALAAAKIINTLNTGKEKIRVILDCPSVSINNWREFLRLQIENLSNLEIVCEHKADRNHASVSAASILAKSQREREMSRLKEVYGEEIGSGYSSDPQTKRFLEKNIKNHNSKGIFRKTWSTWKKANSNSEQKKLF